MTGTALVLGPTGRFGSNASRAFRAAGWDVRDFDRKTGDLTQAARGADVIVNGWNPAYPDWARTVPGLTRDVIAAAQASGATVILPGNVYVFGAEAPERLAADTPHLARNPLGRIRREMEDSYRASGVQTIILRAGDFIDIEATGNWLDLVITKPLAKGRISYPGDPTVPHGWAYLPDMTRAIVQLAGMRDRLDRFEDIPFPGYTLTGQELAQSLSRVTGRTVRATRMSWLPLYLAQPFWKMARHLIEMRYLWSKPHHLDLDRFNALLPEFRHTPLDQAIASAMQHQIDPDKPMARQSVSLDH